MSALEAKKHHELKLKEGLKDVAAKRMELHNSSSSSWPKQVGFLQIIKLILLPGKKEYLLS